MGHDIPWNMWLFSISEIELNDFWGSLKAVTIKLLSQFWVVF